MGNEIQKNIGTRIVAFIALELLFSSSSYRFLVLTNDFHNSDTAYLINS